MKARAEAPRVRDNSDFATDVSVYGVRGMGGNVRDWCADSFVREGPGTRPTFDATGEYRNVRGGSFSSMITLCRAASRFALKPEGRMRAVGFRLVCPL